MLICEGPSSPMEMPLCVPTTFTFTFGIRSGNAQLLESLINDEAREAGNERNLSAEASPDADRHHVRFRDPAFEEAIRELFRKPGGHGGFGEIRVADHYVLILVPEFHQRLAERLACGGPNFSSYFVFAGIYPISCSANSISCCVGATP